MLYSIYLILTHLYKNHLVNLMQLSHSFTSCPLLRYISLKFANIRPWRKHGKPCPIFMIQVAVWSVTSSLWMSKRALKSVEKQRLCVVKCEPLLYVASYRCQPTLDRFAQHAHFDGLVLGLCHRYHKNEHWYSYLMSWSFYWYIHINFLMDISRDMSICSGRI